MRIQLGKTFHQIVNLLELAQERLELA